MDWTDPTLAPPIRIRLPGTRPPASWKFARSVYVEPPLNRTRMTSTSAPSNAPPAANLAIRLGRSAIVLAGRIHSSLLLGLMPFDEHWLKFPSPLPRAPRRTILPG